jgi:hypothetical protein
MLKFTIINNKNIDAQQAKLRTSECIDFLIVNVNILYV